jgi:radical SAM protein with 4Fe4S-binding SPASM domain
MVTKRQPLQVVLFITAACNLHCKVCFYWQEIAAHSRKEELTLDELLLISKSMKRFPWLILSGGEPFVRHDIPEIVECFVTNNRVGYVTIPTNGWHTETIVRTLEHVCHRHPSVSFNVDLSILGMDSLHDEIVQLQGSFKRLTETYRSLKELRNRYPNLSMGAIVTICLYNQDSVGDILSNIVHTFSFNSLVLAKARGSTRLPDAAQVDPKLYRSACHRLEGLIKSGKVLGFPGIIGTVIQGKDVLLHRVIAEISEGRGYRMPCHAGRVSVVISEEGKVYPCELRKMELGDLRKAGMDFQSIWSGPRADEVRRAIHDSHCFCTHECNLTMNILVNPRLVMKAIKGACTITLSRCIRKTF